MTYARRFACALIVLLACAAAPVRAASYSPYVDMTLFGDPALPVVQKSTGARLLSLGFVIATRSRCRPSWGGITPLTSPAINREVREIRATGGDVIVSFGGAAGPALSQVCSTQQSLAAAYETAVRTYNADRVDFDIEGDALDEPRGSMRAILAIGTLEAWARSHHRRLEVSLTVPVDPIGLEPDVLRLLSIARSHRVRVDIVDIMAMDYGNAAAPPRRARMSSYAIEAATATERQLSSALPGGGWSRLEVTVMIGVNDTSDEVFRVDDAETLAAFARSRQIARIGIWSVARDRACGSPTGTAQDTCSGVAQRPDAFSHIFDGL